MYQILIVDEDEHQLWALEKNLFPEREDIRIVTASSGEEGLDLLRGGNVDLLVSDIKMPGSIDGFQLILRAKEVAPDARVMITTAFGTNRIQNLADRIGITHYIEKPFSVSQLRDAILEILDEKEGFQGMLSDLELTDIIQMLCLANRTALLHLKHKEHRGKIVFERGAVIHAEFDEEIGVEAVYRMLALRQGDIYMQSDFQNDRRTIDVGWQDMLLEGVRRSDEARLMESSNASVVGAERSAAEVEEDLLAFPPRLGGQVDSEYDFDDDDSGVHSPTLFPTDEFDEGAGLSREAGLAESTNDGTQRFSTEMLFSDEELEELAEEMDEEDSSNGAPSNSGGFRSSHTPLGTPSVIAEEMGQQYVDDDEFEEAGLQQQAMATGAAAGQDSLDHQAVSLDLLPQLREAPLAGLDELSAPSQQAASNFSVLVEDFARECPGLQATGLFSMRDGSPLHFVAADGNGDSFADDVVAFHFRDVITSATRTVMALDGDEAFEELQIVLERNLVLLRTLPGTPYIHIAIVSTETRLGIAVVLMRRFAQQFQDTMR